MRQKGNSGQILLIAAFIMASLLISAQLYILGVGKTSWETDSDALSDFIMSVQQASRHVVAGSLANMSNGGASNILELNLQEWTSLVTNQYVHGKSTLTYSLRDDTLYSSGIWLYWGTSGYGVSSAYVNFTHRLSGRQATVEQMCFINTTTSLLVASTNQRLNETATLVNVTMSVLNEAKPALVKQITVYYRVSNNWLSPDQANAYKLVDYGNGEYAASFVASFPTENVEISAHILDYRDIYVRANATSIEI